MWVILAILLPAASLIAMAGAAIWTAGASRQSEEFDTEEQEQAMFRSLAAATFGARALPGNERLNCPEMPGLIMLHSALSKESRASIQTESAASINS